MKNIKNFETYSINEDKDRRWGVSNLFSEWHREIGNAQYMIDIDGVYWDRTNNKIAVILEDKYMFKGLEHSNLLQKNNFMRNMLNIFSSHINATLVFCETSTNKWYYVDGSNVIKNDKIEEALKKYEYINTENKLYIEMPHATPTTVMYINDGLPQTLINYLSEFYETIEVKVNEEEKIITIDNNIVDSVETMRELYKKRKY